MRAYLCCDASHAAAGAELSPEPPKRGARQRLDEALGQLPGRWCMAARALRTCGQPCVTTLWQQIRVCKPGVGGLISPWLQGKWQLQGRSTWDSMQLDMASELMLTCSKHLCSSSMPTVDHSVMRIQSQYIIRRGPQHAGPLLPCCCPTLLHLFDESYESVSPT